MGKFIVYEKARESHREICAILSCVKMDAALRDQLKRASTSVILNIGEAQGRKSKIEKKRFFVIARGSAEECRTILHILEDENRITPDDVQRVATLLHEIVKMLTVLIYRW